MLSESDKEYIERHRFLSAKDLASSTKRTVKEIEAYLNTLPELTPEEEQKKATAEYTMPVKGKSRILKKMTETPGTSVMSGSVSSELDKIKPDKIDQPYIFKMRDDK